MCYFLSTDEQTISVLHSDGDNPHAVMLVVDLVKDSEPIVRAEAQFPLRLKCCRWTDRLAIPYFDAGRIGVIQNSIAAINRKKNAE